MPGRSGPRLSIKDKRVITSFIDGHEADGKLLETDGKILRSNVPLGGGILAERTSYGDISVSPTSSHFEQTVYNCIKKNTPSHFFVGNKMKQDLRTERQARLGKTATNDTESWDLMELLVGATDAQSVLEDVIRAMDSAHALEILQYVAEDYGFSEEEMTGE